MRKITLIIVELVFFTSFVKAQNWDSVGCNGLWSECGGYTYSATCLMVYNGSLYVGGAIGTAGIFPINDIAKWNGSTWDSLRGGIISCGGPEAMAVYNDKLIVGGSNFNYPGRIVFNNIGAWNDTTWMQMGIGISVNGAVLAMAVYNGNLYVTGVFDSAGGIPVNNIAMWNGTSWSAVGKGISGNGVFGGALCVYNNKLYVGGHFTSAGGNAAHDIATWDGSNWLTLPGIHPDTGGFHSLTLYNGNLLAGGVFDSVGNVKANSIAQWNGTSWLTVGSGVEGKYVIVSALQNYNGDLYVGGIFDTAGGISVNNFAEWDGSNWHYTPGFTGPWGLYLPAPWVGALAVYNGYMFACGAFDAAGGIPTIDIAGSYAGGTGVNELKGEIEQVKVYPNPNNGQFNLSLSYPDPASGETETQTIEIYNVLGEQVLNQTLKQVQGDNIINMSNQPNGVYLYRVISETGLASGEIAGEGKIIIEK